MVSRRDFLRSSVILPASAAIAAQRRGTTPLRVAVVGAGAFGGWTALHLRRAGAEVTLVDAWGPRNSRASSGGETRVLTNDLRSHAKVRRDGSQGAHVVGRMGSQRQRAVLTGGRACSG